jgi:hypothetical protein
MSLSDSAGILRTVNMPFAHLLCIFMFTILALSSWSASASDGVTGEGPSRAQSTELEGNRQKEAEESKRSRELYLRNQSVFLRKGELMLEVNTFYNRNNRQEFLGTNSNLGQITTRFFDNTLLARYGIFTDGLEIDLIAPVLVYAEQTVDFGRSRSKTTEMGVGDFAAAIRYQAWYERGARPSVVLDVSGKSRTGGPGLLGTGTWNAAGGLTLIKTIDPVVLFGRVGYTYNFASESRHLGNIIDYRLGMGFSLNDVVSFTLQLNGAIIGGSQFKGTLTTGEPGTVAGVIPIIVSTQAIETMTLIFTTTVVVSKNFFLEPIVGVGLTERSFAILGLRMPMTFFRK